MELFKLFGTIGLKGVDDVKNDIDDVADSADDAGSTMTEAFKKIGLAVAAYLSVETIKQFGAALVEASAAVSAEVSAFEQIMGDYTDNAKTKMNEVADATGVVSSRLTPYMTSMTAKFKGLGYDIDTATTLATDGLTLASDAAAFWDKSLDESMGHLNSFINGSYEGGEAIGLFANDTQMAAYAVQQGIVSETKAWSDLDEATKQATRLEYAKLMFEQSGATGQAAKEADQYANVQANLNEKWRQFKAQIGEPVLQNIVIPAIQMLIGLVDGLSKGYETLTNWINENETAVQLIGIAIGTLTAAIVAFTIAQNAATIATKLHTAATAISTAATTAFGTVMAFVTSPITLVIAAIGALIAVGVLLYKNWDTVSAKASEVFGKIKTTISDKLEQARLAVKNVIDKIKGLFDFSWSLPKLKMPHVSISGSFSLVPPRVPKFGIEWYDKAMGDGMILNGPQIFGFQNGNFLGGGESGSETVVGTNSLMNMIRNAVGDQNNKDVLSRLDKILAVLNIMLPKMEKQLVLDTGVLVGGMLGGIDAGLGIEAILKARGVK